MALLPLLRSRAWSWQRTRCAATAPSPGCWTGRRWRWRGLAVTSRPAFTACWWVGACAVGIFAYCFCMRSGDLCFLFAHAQWGLLFSVCACEVGTVLLFSIHACEVRKLFSVYACAVRTVVFCLRMRSRYCCAVRIVVFCLCMSSKECCFLFAHAQ